MTQARRLRTTRETLMSGVPEGGLKRETKMKKFLVSTASVAMLAVASMPAQAAPVDMSTITCAQLLSMKQDEISFILTWVQGYMAGAQEETSMDPDALGKSVTDTVTYCQENQEMSVMNATKEVDGK